MPTGIVAMDLSAGTRSRGAYAPWLAVCIKLNCAYQKPHHCDWGGPPYVSSPSPRAMPKRRNERFGEAEICNACSTQKIPCSDKEFTASAKKFPVPLRREFGCKPLNLPVESTPEITELGPESAKLPVNFPVVREFGFGDWLASDCFVHHAVLH